MNNSSDLAFSLFKVFFQWWLVSVLVMCLSVGGLVYVVAHFLMKWW